MNVLGDPSQVLSGPEAETSRQWIQKVGVHVLQLSSLQKLLSETGIQSSDVIILKGPILNRTRLQFGLPSRHLGGDVDVLMSKDAVRQILRTLAGNSAWDGPHRWSNAAREALLGFGFAANITFAKGMKGVPVDLHWQVEASGIVPRYWADWLSKRTQPINLGGDTYQTLHPIDQIYFIAFHATKHGWSHPDLLIDLVAVVRDWIREQSDRCIPISLLCRGLLGRALRMGVHLMEKQGAAESAVLHHHGIQPRLSDRRLANAMRQLDQVTFARNVRQYGLQLRWLGPARAIRMLLLPGLLDFEAAPDLTSRRKLIIVRLRRLINRARSR